MSESQKGSSEVSELWETMDSAIKLDCLKDMLFNARTRLYQQMHEEKAHTDPCALRIGFLESQIYSLDDIQDRMMASDADRLFRWLLPLAKASNNPR